MQYINRYQSPIGSILLAAEDIVDADVDEPCCREVVT